MNDSERKREEYSLRIKQNEENIEVLRADLKRLEDEEYTFDQNNKRLLRVVSESEGWKGTAARQFNTRMENELLDTFESGKKAFARRYDETKDSIASLRRETEVLREEMKRLEEE